MDFERDNKQKKVLKRSIIVIIVLAIVCVYLQPLVSFLITNRGELDLDSDGLTDYEEIFVYHTNMFKKDSDGDGWTDKEEIDIDSRVFDYFSYFTYEGNYPYDISIKGDFVGSIYNLEVEKSPYIYSLGTNVILGYVPYFIYDENKSVSDITITFHIKDEFIPPDEDAFSKVSDEFEGIKKLQIFTYNMDLNMSVPVETTVGEDGASIYTETDSLGTYFVVNMIEWFKMMGIEPEGVADYAANYYPGVEIEEPGYYTEDEIQNIIDGIKEDREYDTNPNYNDYYSDQSVMDYYSNLSEMDYYTSLSYSYFCSSISDNDKYPTNNEWK